MQMEFMSDRTIWVLTAVYWCNALDVPTARRLLGKDKIVGVSVNTKTEAEIAIRDGADYLGNLAANFFSHQFRHWSHIWHSNEKSNRHAVWHKRFKAHSQIDLAAGFSCKNGCDWGTKCQQCCASTISIRSSFLRGKAGWRRCCKCSDVCRKSTSSSKTIKSKFPRPSPIHL